MVEENKKTEKFVDDLQAGRPELYYDYVYETYGKIFQSGSIQGLETFGELLRQIIAIGNERSILLFAERFFPLLPRKAKREIFDAFLIELQSMTHRTAEENVARRNDLLRKPHILA